MAGFIYGGNTGQTAETLQEARQRMALAMLAQGADTSPIRSGWQGAARLADAIMGGLDLHQQMAGQQYESNRMMQLMSGGDPGPDSPPGMFEGLFGSGTAKTGGSPSSGASSDQGYFPPAPGAQNEMSASAPSGSGPAPADGSAPYRGAIASIESGGNYGSIGPTSGKMGRALGKYQVMEANIGPWSQEALGRTVTPDEFLKNPQIQDAIFDHKFGQYVQQYGPSGAAQAWFAGPGGVGKLNRRDSLGTSVAAYTNRFNNALGSQGGQAAVTAQAAPAPGSTGQGAIPPANANMDADGYWTDASGVRRDVNGAAVDQTGQPINEPNAPPPSQGQTQVASNGPVAPPQAPGGGNVPVTSQGINQAIIQNGGQQNQRPYHDPIVSAPNYAPPQTAGIPPNPIIGGNIPMAPVAGVPALAAAMNGADSKTGRLPMDPQAQADMDARMGGPLQPQTDPTQTASVASPVTPEPVPESAYAATGGAQPAQPDVSQQPTPQPKDPRQALAPWDMPPGTKLVSPRATALANSMPQQGNGLAGNPRAMALMQIMSSPYASPQTREMAGALLQQTMQPQYDYQTLPNGQIIAINKFHPEQPPIQVTQPMKVPQWGVIGKDPVTLADKYGWIDPITRQIIPGPDQSNGSMIPPPNNTEAQPAAPQQATPQAPAPQQTQTNAPQAQPAAPQQAPQQDSATNITVPRVAGESYLDEVAKKNPQWAPYVAQARAVLRGDMPLPTGNAAEKPTDQMVIRLVTAADPQFNGSVAAARGNAIKDFTNGDNPNSSGGQILAANTAIAHMREAAQASEELGKQQVNFGGAPGGSSVANTLQEKLSPNSSEYHKALTRYNAIVTPMAEELTKFYSGAAGTQSSRDAMEAVLDPNSTPEQRRGAFKILIGGLQGKTDELQRKWHQAMGKGTEDFPILGPEAQNSIKYINGLGAPPPKMTQEEYSKAPSGTEFTAPDGSIRTKP